jgi:hypothetical protein
MILGTVPVAFVGGILALLIASETCTDFATARNRDRASVGRGHNRRFGHIQTVHASRIADVLPAGSWIARTAVTGQARGVGMRFRTPDFVAVLLVVLGLVLLAMLTFELWIPHR